VVDHFEAELGDAFLQPARSPDGQRLVGPIMARIEAEDRRRALALGASAIVGAGLAVAAIEASGAARPVRAFSVELWSLVVANAAIPQPGLWLAVPLVAAAFALSALAATRAAQQL